jgi:Ca-activated chloride channel family protein
MEQLKKAIEQALLNGDLFNPEDAERMRQQLEGMTGEQLEKLIEQLANKLFHEGYLSDQENAPGRAGGEGTPRFEVTDKSVDFLGFKTLKDLMGSIGRSSFGAHDTRDLSTGVESAAAPSNTSSATR